MTKKVFSYAFLLGAVVLLISGGIFFGCGEKLPV